MPRISIIKTLQNSKSISPKKAKSFPVVQAAFALSINVFLPPPLSVQDRWLCFLIKQTDKRGESLFLVAKIFLFVYLKDNLY